MSYPYIAQIRLFRAAYSSYCFPPCLLCAYFLINNRRYHINPDEAADGSAHSSDDAGEGGGMRKRQKGANPKPKAKA